MMKEMIGFILFWVAAGMILMMLMPNIFVGIIIIALFLIIGYNLYCCGKHWK
ncbi:MAG TPA: hypothetical protein IAA08_01225 [Candidatus Eubacterium avistercoris]|uniref:Uncharacterized protein n=1 Tax=Candidatus Eubacterium avistercoris TaxID=2838567 RepID=A0A9D2IFK3_9FIRM|nr:hypothetical protein [Candidatus Eubacterium avistercoris]